MPFARLSLLCACALLAAASHEPRPGGIFLAGERVRFDADRTIALSPRQAANTAEATRAGLVRWAATAHGREMIDYFLQHGCEVNVFEDATEDGAGIAPQPGIATLASLGEREGKSFDLVLNPNAYRVPRGMTSLPGQPATQEELMAAAWAAEMLHIYFYAQGISLPHHQRADFQESWSAIAAELGFPGLHHGDGEDDEHRLFARRTAAR